MRQYAQELRVFEYSSLKLGEDLAHFDIFWLYFYDIYCKSKLGTYQDNTAIKSRPARSALFDCIRALAMVSYIGSQPLVDKGNMVLYEH